MKKIFLSGDPTHPLYHRYQNVAAALESVFEAYEIACVSEHFETFETQDYEKYDLAVLYTDHWIDKTGTSHQQLQALVDYVAGGGALLVLHNLDIGVDQGGLHPQRFLPELGHPISDGMEGFALEEERFAVDHAPFTERKVFLTALSEDGTRVPAGWTVEFGMGRAAYLMPGHTVTAFEDPAYRRLIARTADWLTKQL